MCHWDVRVWSMLAVTFLYVSFKSPSSHLTYSNWIFFPCDIFTLNMIPLSPSLNHMPRQINGENPHGSNVLFHDELIKQLAKTIKLSLSFSLWERWDLSWKSVTWVWLGSSHWFLKSMSSKCHGDLNLWWISVWYLLYVWEAVLRVQNRD